MRFKLKTVEGGRWYEKLLAKSISAMLLTAAGNYPNFTNDMRATINNSLSYESKEALKGKRGEDIVNADVAGHGYEATKAETDRKIEIK